MIRIRGIFIVFLLYIVFYISINYNINLLYPYYFLKDMIFYPVLAEVQNKDITLSSNFKDNVISSLQDEIERLKSLTNIQTVLSDFNYVNATIIERNREYWFNTVTIDKGSSDGIAVDMAVVDGNGLVGRVENVRGKTSDIKLLTTSDVTSKISVVIKNKGKDIYGIINGYDSKMNVLKVIINEDVDVYDKMEVLTTGMGGIFPSGIIVGEVFDTMILQDEVTQIVRVRPKSDIKGERYVSILQRKDNS